MKPPLNELTTQAERWYRSILENHKEEARQRALSLLDEADEDQNGCIVSNTQRPRKVRFRGGQDRAYRFVYYVLNERVPYEEELIRHKCHNPCCINPEHLTPGERADNLDDDRLREAYGVDFDWL
jgi:hypothetical protein